MIMDLEELSALMLRKNTPPQNCKETMKFYDSLVEIESRLAAKNVKNWK